ASIEEVQALARAIELKEPLALADERANYFHRGESVGGARPKTLVSHNGAEWLAKFPRDNDLFDNTLAEHLTMRLAREAGINTAETDIIDTDKGRVLLVKRFDQQGSSQAHLISLH